MKRTHLILAGLTLVAMAIVFRAEARRFIEPLLQRLSGEKSVKDRLREYGPAADLRLAPYFKDAQVPYPPAS